MESGTNGPTRIPKCFMTAVTGLGDLLHEEFVTANQNQNVVEIWNDVLVQHEKRRESSQQISQQNVDTGSGLEQCRCLQGKDNIDTDFFAGVMKHIKKLKVLYLIKKSLRSARIVPTTCDSIYDC